MVIVQIRNRAGAVIASTVVDDEDEALVAGRSWSLHSAGYAQTFVRNERGTYTKVFLHRLVLGLVKGDGLLADHINRDRLDNRRSNLRAVTLAQSAQNVSGTNRHRGVSWNRAMAVWEAYWHSGGKKHRVGYFASEDEAADAARKAREAMPYNVEPAA